MQSSQKIPFIKSWKIWLPLGIILGIVAMLAVIFIFLSVKDVEGLKLWSIISMIVLIFLTLISSFIVLILLVISSLAARSLHHKTASVISGTQTRVTRINRFLRTTSETAVRPIFLVNQIAAVLGVIFHKRK